MAETVLFYSFAAVTLFAAVLMVTSRNIFHSALFLALTLFGVASLFVLLHSYFLAGIQVLIYIGAVVVLTLFVINLTREITGRTTPQMNAQVIPAVLTSLLALFLIVAAVLKTDWKTRLPGSSTADNTALLGNQLLTNFAIPFEVVSVLLLAAMIGAVVIISKDKEESK
jgi:NADH-quinone oxidoreductase subunit J